MACSGRMPPGPKFCKSVLLLTVAYLLLVNCGVTLAISCSSANPTIGNGTFSGCYNPLVSPCNGACASGFTGKPVATCVSNNWQVTGQCDKNCQGTPAPAPPNSQFPACQTNANSSCVGTCNTNYAGIVYSVCRNGIFDTPTGTCKAKCTGTPSALANGVWDCSNAPWPNCFAKCNTGYSGVVYATCLAGPSTWSAVKGACNKNCVTNPPDPANGKYTCTGGAGTQANQPCTAICNSGYYGNPAPKAYCKTDGTWTATTGACAGQCAGNPTDPPENGNAYDCSSAKLPYCYGTCSSGYTGAFYSICNGTWQQSVGACAKDCTGQPPDLPNRHGTYSCLQNQPFGTWCYATCDTGYTASTQLGPPKSFCQSDGTYSDDVGGACVPV